MKRSEFLKKLGLGALAVTVAPKVIEDIKEAPLKVKEPIIEETDTYYNATTLEPEWYNKNDWEIVWCTQRGEYSVNDIITSPQICDKPCIVYKIEVSEINDWDVVYFRKV